METPLKKVVINTCVGAFSLSHQAFLRLRELGQAEALAEPDRGHYWPHAALPNDPSLNQCGLGIPRDDRTLVQVVEELGALANGHCAALKVVEIPADAEWHVESMPGAQGMERVLEAHRAWS